MNKINKQAILDNAVVADDGEVTRSAFVVDHEFTLSGTSWQADRDSITLDGMVIKVTGLCVTRFMDEDGVTEDSMTMTIDHNGPYQVYGNDSFEEGVSELFDNDIVCGFSEQGMNLDNGRAHFDVDSK